MPYRPPVPEPYRDEEWLREKYIAEELSTREIGDLCDRSKETIRRWLDRHGIPKRSKSEAARIRALRYPHTTEAGAQAIRDVNSWDGWTTAEREAFRRRLSAERTGEKNPMYGVTGDRHPRWNPDADYPSVYHTPEWRRTRRAVYRRDSWTCRECGAKDRRLHAHHVTPLSEGGAKFDMDNLTTVCEECHYELHRTGHTDV